MNLFDSSFLCLDIGTSGVRGIAHRVRSGRFDKSAYHSVDSTDTIFALKSVIDELENQIGAHFDSAYITGNFGTATFDVSARKNVWNSEHRITVSDVQNQIKQITPPENSYPMHIIPLGYQIPSAKKVLTPVGFVDHSLTSVFGTIFYETARLDEILKKLRKSHIQPDAFFDPQFLLNSAIRKKNEILMFVDLGAEFTSASIWTDRGPIWFTRIPHGGANISHDIAQQLSLPFDDADRIKRTVASMMPKEMDRFTPADIAYDFSRADVNDIIVPHIIDIIAQIKESGANILSKYAPSRIVLTGGGAEIESMPDFFENAFGIPAQNIRADATIKALSKYIWAQEAPHVQAYLARRERMSRIGKKIKSIFNRPKKRPARFIPILPSTLCFNMKNPSTYSLFNAGGISMIHVDIMDGLYVDKIAGGIPELKHIRAQTRDHLHVHLMTVSPTVWASDAVAAGADTVILSTNTVGLRIALRQIRASGRRAGIALNPETPINLLKDYLREIDEVMIMGVAPGAAGQRFQPDCVRKIAALDATRKKFNLKYTISVDGGINPQTAQQCWAAGADILVCGSYLAKSADFPLAVQSLLKQPTN